MSLASKKAGTQFAQKTKTHGKLTPREWAHIMLSVGFPASTKTIAEGLGIINRESGFDSNPGGDGAHYGAWQEDSSFGSVAQRLDPVHSTREAKKRWEADGKSFYPAWGRWQLEQGGVDGATQWKTYAGTAQSAIASAGFGVQSAGTQDGGGGWIDGVPDPGDLLEAGGDVVDSAMSAADFLAEMASTILDFRKLGQLAAEAMAWFTRLLAKALWDYVVAPLYHWTERAVSWYWTNFFDTGTEQGSGFGFQLRQNAGIITIGFWAIGYGVLWTAGDSPAAVPAHESMLGRGIKGVEGQIARRNLIKPAQVKEKTPEKPKAKSSTIKIERAQQFSVARKRPVSVTSSAGTVQVPQSQPREGNDNVSSERRVPRPQTGGEEKKLILPESVKNETARAKTVSQTKVKADAKTPKSSGAGLDSRGDSGSGSKSPASTGGK